ncbi:substrate-binding domain-containing protein [uncultured Erythrobacter sp.]|uniref:substrate-binding domain-containing protein n=1 Tax=uncultured Erythrobacter sp. TaxID=263913 RepID=UPI00261B398C|nr:substrate-binding domain-containing protein [uncultured Erythrobacter sp.]
MNTKTPRSNLLRDSRLLLVGASLAILAACGETEEDAGVDAISIVGSSTVFPFAEKVAADFVAANEGMAAPSIESTGSTEGIETFCAGEGPDTPDIVNASRRMTVTEFNGCSNNGVSEIIEIKVGRDGIAFASSIDDGIEIELSPSIIYRALAANPFGEEQTAANWSDVDGSLPNEPITVYGPPATSGTRDALLDIILQPACTTNGAMAALEESDPTAFEQNCHALRGDSAYIDQGEQDDLIVRKIANNPRAIGMFGYSYLEENPDSVKALPVGGVLPTAETIADESYPASRPLYIYVKKAHIGVTPGIQEYLNQWSQSWSAGGPLTAIGLVPASDEVQAASAETVSNLTVMNSEGF